MNPTAPILRSSAWLAALVAGISVSCWAAPGGLWTTAYYPGYEQGYLAASNIDFTAVTHLIHFSVVPNADGSLNLGANGITAARTADLVSRAHAAGRPVLLCVGGANSQAGFEGATTDANRATFVSNLIGFVTNSGYDGIDLDWEPLATADGPQYTNLVNDLRSALNQMVPRRLLTAAAALQDQFPALPSTFAALQAQFDQINLMTYDLSGPYAGWVTWFNAPLFDGGYYFPHTTRLVPSTDGMVKAFESAGVAPGKLGIGIAFYGIVWSGGSGTSTGGASLPRQSWTVAPTVTPKTYHDLMSSYYQPSLYHWDDAAQAAYLSIDSAGSTNDNFISYDDRHTGQAKVSYARNQALGGIMIWELGQGYQSTNQPGQRDPLLQAIKQALATPQWTAIGLSNQSILLDFSSLPLASYRVTWSTDLVSGPWATLSTLPSGTNATTQLVDPGATATRLRRFYRVQTPP